MRNHYTTTTTISGFELYRGDIASCTMDEEEPFLEKSVATPSRLKHNSGSWALLPWLLTTLLAAYILVAKTVIERGPKVQAQLWTHSDFGRPYVAQSCDLRIRQKKVDRETDKIKFLLMLLSKV